MFASMDSAHIRCVVPTSQHRPTSSISRLAYFEIHSFRTIRGPVPLPNVELHWTEFISHRRPVCNGHRQMNIEPMWKATIFLIFSIFFNIDDVIDSIFNLFFYLLRHYYRLWYIYIERELYVIHFGMAEWRWAAYGVRIPCMNIYRFAPAATKYRVICCEMVFSSRSYR